MPKYVLFVPLNVFNVGIASAGVTVTYSVTNAVDGGNVFPCARTVTPNAYVGARLSAGPSAYVCAPLTASGPERFTWNKHSYIKKTCVSDRFSALVINIHYTHS